MNNSDKNQLVRKWLGKLTSLNPATGRGQCSGKAPHKPLLLLSLIDMAEQGEIKGRTFTRTPGLVLRFKSYGSLVSERWPTRLDMRMPFYHLKSQDFWSALTIEMTPARSMEVCFVCEMHEEFFDLLSDADFRIKARLILISTYFPGDERLALLESLGLSAANTSRRLANIEADVAEAARRKGRSARFSIKVVSGYKFTCALTGLCCLTTDGAAIVDAAHIEPWAKTRNDDPTNGLALCKNAHWMFDEGLWSVKTGRIIVADSCFKELGPEQLRLNTYAGRLLQFADGVSLRPEPRYFETHRSLHGFR